MATQEGAGRSSTAQMLHASEAAFWVSLMEQLAALMQTIPDIDGTEIILETTGNQFGDEFHQLWRRSQAGETAFVAIFLPWSIDATYRKPVPEDFTMTADEQELADLHKLDAEQIYWRRCKIAEIGGSEDYFKREYPLTPDEAFMASQFDSYITNDLVLKARKTTDIEPYGPLIIGVDPAGKGADSTAIAWRRGHSITKTQRWKGLDTMQVAGLVGRIIREEKPAKVNIDVGGLGVGVADRLEEQGYQISRVNFGGKPVEPPPFDENGKPAGGPANRRAELYVNLKAALQGRFSLPDSDSLHSDLVSMGYKFMSDGRLLLESKEDMRKRGMPSPDEGDAVALCFTEPDGSPFPHASNFHRKIEYPGGAYV